MGEVENNMKEKIKGILFDADGVVVQAKQFSSSYQREFDLADDAMSPFFRGIFQECVLGKVDLLEAVRPFLKEWKWDKTAEEFLQFWFKSEHCINQKLVEKIKQLRSEGVNCYLATNQEKHRAKYMMEEMGLKNIFDGIFFSAELGFKKPDPEFFQKVLNILKIEGKEVLFFDDDQKNVDGAKKVDIKSFLYTDFEKFEQDFKTLPTSL